MGQPHEFLIAELGCNVNDSTVGHAMAIATSKYSMKKTDTTQCSLIVIV